MGLGYGAGAMLTPHDDYPIHQTPLPVAHTVSSDPNHYDRYWFNGYTTDGSLFFAAALGHYPNRGVIDGAFSVVRGGVQRSVFVSGRMPLDRSTRIGPWVVEVLEPLRTIRLSLGENEHGMTADLVFTAVTAAVEEPRQTMTVDSRAQMDSTRLTQWGRWTGTVTIDGEAVSLDRAHGTRDRSWGVRGVGAPTPTNLPARAPQIFWLWAPVHFDNFCTHLAAFEHANGHRWMSAARWVPHLERPESPTWGVDTSENLNWWDYDIDWKPGTREIARAVMTTNRLSGEAIRLELEPMVTFRMRGIGYIHPRFGHGHAHGELAVNGETLDLSTVNPEDPSMVHIQTLSRVHSNIGEGIGVLEQLVLGDHAPTGLTGIADGWRG